MQKTLACPTAWMLASSSEERLFDLNEYVCISACFMFICMGIQYCTAFNHTSGALNKFSVLSSDNLDIYWKRCMLQTTLSAYNFTRMYVHVLLAKRFIFSVFIRV